MVKISVGPCPSHVVNGLTPSPQNQPTARPESFQNTTNNQGTMAQPIPEALAHLVGLNVEFNVLICLQCKYAVKPTTISRHFGDKHKTPIKLRKQLDEYVREFPFQYDHTSVRLPSNKSAPQPIIPVLDGHLCKDPDCQYMSRNRDVIRQHSNQAHNKKRDADEDLFESVQLQSWFDDRRARYWIVDQSKQAEQERQRRRARTRDVGEETDDSDHSNASANHSESDQDDVDDQIVQDIEKWKSEAQERRLRLLKEVPVVEMDSWLQFTKWNDILSQSKHDFVKTFHYTRMPDPDEPQLERLLRAWNQVFERCLDTLEATDHKDALKWWASPKNEAASQRPFELPQNAKSIGKYSGFYECFICYMIRTAPTEDYTDETGRLIIFIKKLKN
jgi:orsellinic acid/F9775 biosynthesis protein OrsD